MHNQLAVIDRLLAEDDSRPRLAGADVQELLQKAELAREGYPDVGAISLVDDGEWTLRPDGTQVRLGDIARVYPQLQPGTMVVIF